MKLLSLPNLLSFVRLPLAAAFVLTETRTARIAIVAIVAISDMLDGYFARRVRSHDRATGQIVDPVTDKLFVLIALIAFAVRREVTIPELAALLIRDLFNTVAFIVLKVKRWNITFKARMSGKAVTVLQLAAVFALVFWHDALRPIVWAVAVLSVYAIFDYSRDGLRQRHALAPSPQEL